VAESCVSDAIQDIDDLRRCLIDFGNGYSQSTMDDAMMKSLRDFWPVCVCVKEIAIVNACCNI